VLAVEVVRKKAEEWRVGTKSLDAPPVIGPLLGTLSTSW